MGEKIHTKIETQIETQIEAQIETQIETQTVGSVWRLCWLAERVIGETILAVILGDRGWVGRGARGRGRGEGIVGGEAG